MNKKRTILIILFISLILTGCVNIKKNDRQETRTLDLLVENTKTIIPTVTNILPTATKAVIVLPTLTATVEPSLAPSPHPSLTALPTLNNNDANRTVLELANTNGNCEMPCLWGIVPGQTRWETIDQYYASLRFDIESNPYKCKDESKNNCVWYTATKMINDIKYGFGVIVEDGIVTKVTITGNSAKAYFPLDKVLNSYEIPSDIYIETYIGPGVSTPVYFALFYDKQYLLITYEVSGKILDDVIHVCPHNYESYLWVDVYGYNSEKYNNYKESLLEPDEIMGGRHYPIGERIGVTEKEFYELFVNKVENNCIDLQIDWK